MAHAAPLLGAPFRRTLQPLGDPRTLLRGELLPRHDGLTGRRGADLLLGRLGSRGRESEAEILGRLAREVPAALPNAIRIDNSGALDDGIARFTAALYRLAED